MFRSDFFFFFFFFSSFFGSFPNSNPAWIMVIKTGTQNPLIPIGKNNWFDPKKLMANTVRFPSINQGRKLNWLKLTWAKFKVLESCLRLDGQQMEFPPPYTILKLTSPDHVYFHLSSGEIAKQQENLKRSLKISSLLIWIKEQQRSSQNLWQILKRPSKMIN